MSEEHPNGTLVDRLRRTLQAARGDLQIRERLTQMIAEPGRLDEIVAQLGGRHTLVRDLLSITRAADSTQNRAA